MISSLINGYHHNCFQDLNNLINSGLVIRLFKTLLFLFFLVVRQLLLKQPENLLKDEPPLLPSLTLIHWLRDVK